MSVDINDYGKHFLEDYNSNDFEVILTKYRKKKIFELLSQAGNVYLDEYYIDHTITELNNSKVSREKREEVIKNYGSLNRYYCFSNSYCSKEHKFLFVDFTCINIEISELIKNK